MEIQSLCEAIPLISLFFSILGAGGAIIIIPSWAIKIIKRYSRRRAFFGSKNQRYIVVGSPQGGPNIRTADLVAFGQIKRIFNKYDLPDNCQLRNNVNNVEYFQNPLLIFGSPRLNDAAENIQKRLDLPFEFVSLTPDLPSLNSTLCIYEKSGQEYICSSDPYLGEMERDNRPPTLSGYEYDYGLLVVGNVTDSHSRFQRIIWIAGIHGIGTLGVTKWVLDNIDSYDWEKLGNVCFLIKIRFQMANGIVAYDRPPQFLEDIENTECELIKGPCQWEVKEQVDTPIRVLCDMGNVLLSFNRSKLEDNLNHLCGVNNISAQQRASIKKIESDFEDSTITINDFFVRMKACLNLETITNEKIKLAWNDIFWRNEEVIRYLVKCQEGGLIKLILITNTDPLRLDFALHCLGLNKLFDDEHIVASFDDDVNPKNVDNSMLHKGIQLFEREGNCNYNTPAVFIDDIREYLIEADNHGVRIEKIHFRKLSQLIYDLRRHGVYLPI